MQRICRSVIGLALLATPLIACGGDDDGGGGTTPDAKVFMDAAIDSPPACVLPATIAGNTVGSDAQRQALNWISKNTSGVTSFGIVLPLDATNKNLLQLTVRKQGTTWKVNTPINFDPTPTNATAEANALVAENYNMTSKTADKYFYASSGSITFTEIAQTAGAKITFSTTPANFRQIDPMTGADVPGGCTTMVGTWTVFVQQMDAVQALVPPSEPSKDWHDSLLLAPPALAR
jgi:hypothetical protein